MTVVVATRGGVPACDAWLRLSCPSCTREGQMRDWVHSRECITPRLSHISHGITLHVHRPPRPPGLVGPHGRSQRRRRRRCRLGFIHGNLPLPRPPGCARVRQCRWRWPCAASAAGGWPWGAHAHRDAYAHHTHDTHRWCIGRDCTGRDRSGRDCIGGHCIAKDCIGCIGGDCSGGDCIGRDRIGRACSGGDCTRRHGCVGLGCGPHVQGWEGHGEGDGQAGRRDAHLDGGEGCEGGRDVVGGPDGRWHEGGVGGEGVGVRLARGAGEGGEGA